MQNAIIQIKKEFVITILFSQKKIYLLFIFNILIARKAGIQR
jgi:hypothetical protein